MILPSLQRKASIRIHTLGTIHTSTRRMSSITETISEKTSGHSIGETLKNVASVSKNKGCKTNCLLKPKIDKNLGQNLRLYTPD